MKYFVKDIDGNFVQLKNGVSALGQLSQTQTNKIMIPFCEFRYGVMGTMYAVMQGPQLWQVYDEKHNPLTDESRVQQVWRFDKESDESIHYCYTE